MSQDIKAHTNSLSSKAHEIGARTFPSIILNVCRSLQMRTSDFENAFGVPKQRKTKVKKSMIKFSNKVVG